MGPMNLYFDFRDIFRAPRLALSGKKIWIFIVGNLAGYIVYWVFTYLSLVMSGIEFGDALSRYGLYPCLFGNDSPILPWIIYGIGIEAWIISIFLSPIIRLLFKSIFHLLTALNIIPGLGFLKKLSFLYFLFPYLGW